MKRNHPKPSDLKPLAPDEEAFSEIVWLIAGSRQQAIQAVNSTLIDLYWQVGETISRRSRPRSGAMAWSRNWLSTSRERSPGFVASPALTCSE
jgi:hypothetical protein